MKILNSVTVKNLKKNKKRTIVTILGIVLSVALICAITTFIASFQKAMIERTKVKSGSYHIMVSHVTEEQQKYLENNAKAEKIATSQTLGYAKFGKLENEYKPYVYVQSFDQEAFQTRGVKITQGRAPENENEIVIPDHMLTNGSAILKIGDTITLKLGKRMLEGEELTQNNPYYTQEDIKQAQERKQEDDTEIVPSEPEILQVEFEKQYTIVGIMERPNFEDYSAPGYTCLTKLEKAIEGRETQISLVLKNPSETYKLQEMLNQKIGVDVSDLRTNEELLTESGVFKSDRTSGTFTILAAIVIGIIIFTSVFVIRNSFTISLTEKTKELGMLASIGATSKQIRNSILWEGCILGGIAIPLGVITGITAIGCVLAFVNYLINQGNTPIIDNFNLQLEVSGIAILIAVVLAILMIFISAIKPARRAAKIAPIDAIRESNDVKITNKKLKISPITKKVFGIEGEIASKNFKRSKKKYRTTIFSIILSIVLFISMNSLIENTFKITNYTYQKSEDNVSVRYPNHSEEETEEYFSKIEKLDTIEKYAIIQAGNIVVKAEDYLSEKEKEYHPNVIEEHISVVAVGNTLYENYVKELGLDLEDTKNKAILYDTNVYIQVEEGKDGVKRVEYNRLKVGTGDTIEYEIPQKREAVEKAKTGKIEIALKTDKTPMSLFKSDGNAVLIVSDERMKEFDGYGIGSMAIKSNDPDKLTEEIIKLDESNRNNIYNQNQANKENDNMILIISIFLYGFIAVISIIGITNVFNTITTNMALRHKEFAVLKSIGMTEKEFKKMIHYESLLYGTKSLLIGIPIGLVFSYFIYKVMSDIYTAAYQIPWIPILISIVFVFAIIFITMRYSVKKSEKQNIIETIRKENI